MFTLKEEEGAYIFLNETSDQNNGEISWAEIYRGRFFGSNLVSFNRALVPYEISKVNFCAEFFFLSVCEKRFNKI